MKKASNKIVLCVCNCTCKLDLTLMWCWCIMTSTLVFYLLLNDPSDSILMYKLCTFAPKCNWDKSQLHHVCILAHPDIQTYVGNRWTISLWKTQLNAHLLLSVWGFCDSFAPTDVALYKPRPEMSFGQMRCSRQVSVDAGWQSSSPL